MDDENNDVERSAEHAVEVVEKIGEIESVKAAVDFFVEHFEKTIPVNGKIIPRQAKTGAKALKKMVTLIDEYEELYGDWLKVVGMTEDQLNALSNEHEFFDLAPSRTGEQELAWANSVSRAKIGFASYRKQDGLGAAELGLAFLNDPNVSELLDKTLGEHYQSVIDASSVRDKSRSNQDNVNAEALQGTPKRNSGNNDEGFVPENVSPIPKSGRGTNAFFDSSRILDPTLDKAEVSHNRIRRGIPNLKKRTEDKISILKKQIDDGDPPASVIPALSRLEAHLSRDPNNDVGKLLQ